ncbi:MULTISPECIES: RidA family protein [Providencia]|uniref:RidA family protein n=1 Tax=Providencia TaxID=586 RepID=UPI0018C69A78|nr:MULTISPECIES: RidA family protein [Providencia]MBG5920707.1 RidA family protein [Providencia stuartii]
MNILKTNDCVIIGWHSSCSQGDFDTQLKEIIIDVNNELFKMGIHYSDMLKHTIAIKSGQVDPIYAINQFHKVSKEISKGYGDKKPVGTIIKLPHFNLDDVLVSIEFVFSCKKTQVRCLPFYNMDMDVSRSLIHEELLYITGTEALVVSDNTVTPYYICDTLEEQVSVIINKIYNSIVELDYSIDDIFLLNVYLRSDIAYQDAISLIKDELAKYTNSPSSINCNINITYCDGMAVDSFLIEIDGFVKNHQLNIDNPIDYQCFQFNLDLYDSFTSAKKYIDTILKDNSSPRIRVTTKYVKSKNSSGVYIDIIHDELMMKLASANVSDYIIETLPVRKLMNNKSFLEINIHSF